MKKVTKRYFLPQTLSRDVFKDCSSVQDWGGDEFVVLAEETDNVQISAMIKEFNRRMEYGHGMEIDINASSDMRWFMRPIR